MLHQTFSAALLTTALGCIAGAAFTRRRLVDEHKSLHRRLSETHHQATHDPLTLLANRAGLAEQSQSLFADDAVLVALIDLDDFKPINDQNGHHAGDQILTTVGRRLTQKTAGTGGIVARLGGDEFAVLLPIPEQFRSAPSNWAQQMLRVLHLALSRPAEIGGLELSVGASIGGAIASLGQRISLGDALSIADAAMYRAKKSGSRISIADNAMLSAVDGEAEMYDRPSIRIRDFRSLVDCPIASIG